MKKLIKDLNYELGNTIIYDDRIYQNYQFEEYVPRFKNIKDQADMAVIQKMNELIGFEFDKIKPNNSNNENKPDNSINYQNIDNNFLFILLTSKFTGGELLNQKEKEMMLKLFNEEKSGSFFVKSSFRLVIGVFAPIFSFVFPVCSLLIILLIKPLFFSFCAFSSGDDSFLFLSSFF